MSNQTLRTPAFLRLGLAAALLLAAGAQPLRGADRPKFGGAVTLSLPTSDLKTDTKDKVGFGAAFQVTFDLGQGHAVRPRADFTVYNLKETRLSGSDAREYKELVSYGLGADYLYYVKGRADQGVYLLAGVGVQRWNVAINTHDSDDDRYTSETTHRKTSVGGAVGLGVQVNHWFGVEARYAFSRYEGTQGVTLADSTAQSPAVTRNAGAVQIAATFRW